MQKLPAGIQDFSRIREENYLYVDKTKYILDLIDDGVFLFFARPRRFGKSLICSTLKYLYQGRKELFKGLYIEDKIDWNKMNFPVIHIDFSKMDLKKLPLDHELDTNFIEICESFNLIPTKNGASADLQMIINHFAKKNQKIVILVDEYDKGLNDFLDNPAIFEENKKILRGFFSRLKPNDIHIEKCFFTSISKYGKISVFSALNNLTDISLQQKYVTMCGITNKELVDNFSLYIQNVAKKLEMTEDNLIEKMKSFYNGFSFDAQTSVYNVYSLFQFFILENFKNFWFDTGTSEMLIELLKEQNILVDELEGTKMEYAMLDLADNTHQNVVSLLFQTGYLTLKSKILEYGEIEFELGFPNIEVKQAFSRHLMVQYTQKSVDRISTNIALPLRKAMRNKDFEKIFEILKK